MAMKRDHNLNVLIGKMRKVFYLDVDYVKLRYNKYIMIYRIELF